MKHRAPRGTGGLLRGKVAAGVYRWRRSRRKSRLSLLKSPGALPGSRGSVIYSRRQDLFHGKKLHCEAGGELITDPVRTFETERRVKPYAGKGGHQLQ